MPAPSKTKGGRVSRYPSPTSRIKKPKKKSTRPMRPMRSKGY